jgi:hypothetical protein
MNAVFAKVNDEPEIIVCYLTIMVLTLPLNRCCWPILIASNVSILRKTLHYGNIKSEGGDNTAVCPFVI